LLTYSYIFLYYCGEKYSSDVSNARLDLSFFGELFIPPQKQQYGALEKQTIFGQPQRFGPEKLRVR